MIKPVLVKQQGVEGKYLSLWGWGTRAQALRFNSEADAREHATRCAPAMAVDVEPLGVELQPGEGAAYSPWAKRA